MAAPQRHVATRITISASPARIWAVLTDTADYAAWAPGFRLSGTLSPGHVITHVEGEGADAMVFHPTVVTADPARELRWVGRVWFPRLFDVDHSFLLRPSAAGTLVIQAEDFRGIAVPFFDVQQLILHFDAVNAALKQRAEHP